MRYPSYCWYCSKWFSIYTKVYFPISHDPWNQLYHVLYWSYHSHYSYDLRVWKEIIGFFEIDPYHTQVSAFSFFVSFSVYLSMASFIYYHLPFIQEYFHYASTYWSMLKAKSLYLIQPCTFLVRNFSDFIWYIPLFSSHISIFLIYYFLLCSFCPLRSLTLLLQFHFQNIVPSFGLLHFVESLIWSTFMQIQFWLLMKWLVYWIFLLLLPYLFLPSFLL